MPPTAKNITLDAVDRKMLGLLQEDATLSVAELADHLGMTPPPCWRRMRRLKDAGVLQAQVWIVDPASLGLEIVIYALVKLTTHDAAATRAFRQQIKALPEVIECYILLGSTDVLLKIIVSDVKYYEEFFYKKLSQLPGVREVNSNVVLSEVKKTYRLPIGML